MPSVSNMTQLVSAPPLNFFHRRYEWLALPHNIIVSPNEAVVRESFSFVTRVDVRQTGHTGHPHREHWHQIGHRFKQRFFMDEDEVIEPGYGTAPHGSCRVQAVRSVSDWSHGVLTEHSIQN